MFSVFWPFQFFLPCFTFSFGFFPSFFLFSLWLFPEFLNSFFLFSDFTSFFPEPVLFSAGFTFGFSLFSPFFTISISYSPFTLKKSIFLGSFRTVILNSSSSPSVRLLFTILSNSSLFLAFNTIFSIITSSFHNDILLCKRKSS